ncbi:30S ribosomal protein S12 methylthiotransferase RimO [bacterium]|nr:30S ribosomal protein S12 methylthiotransferase RimO [bacterium]
MKHTVGIYSLGCAKNLSDTEIMLGSLVKEGFQIVDPVAGCEIVVVNTCCFIDDAKEESIETVLEAVNLKSKGLCRYILVTGCLSQRYGKQLFELIPEVDQIIGISQLDEVGWICRNLPKRSCPSIEPPGKLYPFRDFPKVSITPSHYAYLKIAEGCRNNCSYCVIPLVRGTLRSRPLNDILEEARFLNDLGVQELIITAQDITHYGSDLDDGVDLIRLLTELVRLPRISWIRLLYAHPDNITQPLLDIMQSEKKILPYLDVPIQHIDQKILRKMGRRGDTRTYTRLFDTIRKMIPDISLRTTLIVGFPGETDEQFRRLHAFIKDNEFDHLGVFKYSRESGTRAAKMRYQVSDEIKQERADVILKTQAAISQKRLKRFQGRLIDVLVEDRVRSDNGQIFLTARAHFQAPEVDGLVLIKDDHQHFEPGVFKRVRIERTSHYDLFGSVVYPCGTQAALSGEAHWVDY